MPWWSLHLGEPHDKQGMFHITELWKVIICYLENKDKMESRVQEEGRVLKISSEVVRLGQFLAVLSCQLHQKNLESSLTPFFFSCLMTNLLDQFASVFRVFLESDSCRHLPPSSLVQASSSERSTQKGTKFEYWEFFLGSKHFHVYNVLGLLMSEQISSFKPWFIRTTHS